MLVKEVKRIMWDKRFKKTILIFGCNQKNELAKIVEIVETISNDIILSQSPFPKAMPIDKLEKLFSKKVEKIKNVNDAISAAKKRARNKDLILVAGSCYLIGDVKRA